VSVHHPQYRERSSSGVGADLRVSSASAVAAVGAKPVSGADAVLAQLSDRWIDYNRPPAISFDHDTPVTLVIEMLGKGTGIGALPPGGGLTNEVSVKLSSSVTAILSGPPDDVKISLSEPSATQPLFAGANAQWDWNVKALRPGSVVLNLQLYSTVKANGAATTYQIRTFSDRFRVSMSTTSWLEWQINQIQPIWKFLGLGTPVAIGLGLIAWWRRRARRRGVISTPADEPVTEVSDRDAGNDGPPPLTPQHLKSVGNSHRR
jgi:hypothetical protein